MLAIALLSGRLSHSPVALHVCHAVRLSLVAWQVVVGVLLVVGPTFIFNSRTLHAAHQEARVQQPHEMEPLQTKSDESGGDSPTDRELRSTQPLPSNGLPPFARFVQQAAEPEQPHKPPPPPPQQQQQQQQQRQRQQQLLQQQRRPFLPVGSEDAIGERRRCSGSSPRGRPPPGCPWQSAAQPPACAAMPSHAGESTEDAHAQHQP